MHFILSASTRIRTCTELLFFYSFSQQPDQYSHCIKNGLTINVKTRVHVTRVVMMTNVHHLTPTADWVDGPGHGQGDATPLQGAFGGRGRVPPEPGQHQQARRPSLRTP